MTNRQRIKYTLDGTLPQDRLPVIEWAGWWGKTLDNWKKEKSDIYTINLFDYLNLDLHHQFWIPANIDGLPAPKYHGAPVVNNEQEYANNLKYLFNDEILIKLKDDLEKVKPLHDSGKTAVWFTLNGFFWFPRVLLGIQNHLYAFYDYPEMMHDINKRLTEFNSKAIDVIYSVLTPEFMTFAEDMSYNHGPMLSKECFDEFLSPYYKQLIPKIKAHGTKVLIDTDGDVEPLIPWFSEVGIEGVIPLERQAGVDVNRIRQNHPHWIMIGGYDKTIMHKGEEAIRLEFERLLPAMKSGRYIPCVDHQTPPDVSLENYKIYVKLAYEYAAKAVI